MALIKQFVDLHNLPGNAYSKLGFLTVVSGVTNTNNQGFFVSDGALQINPNYSDNQSGTHATQSIDVRDTSAAFSVKVTKQGVVNVQSLTNPEQHILFQLSKDKGTTSGVNLIFADGALAVTAKTNNNGKMSFSITDGGTDSADWFTSGSRALTAGKVYDLAIFGPNGDKDLLNENTNSQGVKDWTGGVGPDGQTYTLTTNIETVPAAGVLNLNDKVTGVNNGNATSTFQTGDTINGGGTLAKNVLTITETAASAAIFATVKNVDTINHQNIGGAAVNYDEILYSGVNNENVTKAVAGSVTNLTNAGAATVYGDSAGVADTLTVSFANSGVTSGQTFNLNLAGAGASGAASNIDYVGAAADINAIAVATSGTNNVILNGTTSVKTITVTGAGNNTIALTGAGAFSATSAVTIDASKATGNITIDLGANTSAGGVSILGTTGTSNTIVGLVLAGATSLPTITNVDGLQIDAGSVGTLITAPNTSIKTVVVQSGVVGANALVGTNGVNSIVYQTVAGANTYGALTTPATGATTVTFAQQGTGTLGALTVGALTVDGATSLAINTAGGTGSTSAQTFLGVNGNTLTSISATSASTGLLALGVITNAAAPQTLNTIDLSKVSGTASAGLAATELAANSTITGAVLGTTLNSGVAGVNIVDQAVAFTLYLTGNNTILGGAQTGNVTVVSSDILGNASTITTGAGNDLVQLGLGTNTVDTGAGSDLVTINSSSTAVDTFNVTVTGNTTTFSGLKADVINVGVGANVTSLNLGTGHTASTVNVAQNTTDTLTLNGLNGDTVAITGTGGTAGTVTEGTHTTGTAFTIGAAAAAVTVDAIAGVIAADTFALANAGGTVTLTTVTGTGGSTYTLTGDGGANTFAATFNTTGGTNTISYATGDNGAYTIGATSTSNLTLSGSGAFTQTVTDSGNGHTIDLGTHTARNTINLTANAGNSTTYDTLTGTQGAGGATADLIDFAGAGAVALTIVATGNAYASVAAGVTALLAGGVTAGRAYTFTVGSDTVVYDATVTGTAAGANDTVVTLTGSHTIVTSGAADGAFLINS